MTEDLKVAARVGTRKKRVESRGKLLLLEPGKMGVAAGTQVCASMDVGAVLSPLNLTHLLPLLDGHDLVLERAALLVKLKELGVDKLPERQKIATAIAKAFYAAQQHLLRRQQRQPRGHRRNRSKYIAITQRLPTAQY